MEKAKTSKRYSAEVRSLLFTVSRRIFRTDLTPVLHSGGRGCFASFARNCRALAAVFLSKSCDQTA
jgi:hypothetical protein